MINIIFRLKSFIKGIPIVGNLLLTIKRLILGQDGFGGSKKYWEERYALGGNSGSGSSGRLAIFKAEFLNEFVEKNKIYSIIEFGFGDGNQLSLARYPSYVGIDVSQTALEMCRKKFEKDTSKAFMLYRSFERKRLKADLVLSLDVVYHLVENAVFEKYMFNLFEASDRFVIIYSSNNDDDMDSSYHVRMRNFLLWVTKSIKGWTLVNEVLNKYPFDANDPENTSHSNFYVFEKSVARKS